MDDFELELRTGFLEEASQLMTDAEQSFLELEQNPQDKGIFERIFRVAHNLKGSSKAVGFDSLGTFTHEFESFLLKFKNGLFQITPEAISLLLKVTDHVSQSVQKLKDNMSADVSSPALVALMQQFTPSTAAAVTVEEPASVPEVPSADAFGEGEPFPDQAMLEASTPSAADTDVDKAIIAQILEEENEERRKAEAIASQVIEKSDVVEATIKALDESPKENFLTSELRQMTDENLEDVLGSVSFEDVIGEETTVSGVLATQLDEIAANVPEVQAPKTVVVATVEQPKVEAMPAKAATEVLAKVSNAAEKAVEKVAKAQIDETIRVSLSRVERLINFVGELVIFQTVLREQSFNSNPLLLRKTIHQMGKVTKEVQDLSMSLRMIPLKQTFQKMQRIVRDTAGLLKKDIQLVLEGEDTEVDKVVLEALNDPLVHVIRNAVDHGIEGPEQRARTGKPSQGKIHLRALHQGGKLIIEIIDDGNGIDAKRVQQKAIEKGLLKPGTELSEKEAIQLIFHPGFSTKTEVTEVSGRGVGMDVVKTNIDQLQGEIDITTVVGKGSVFRIMLPLTLAIIDGMIVRVGEDRFVIPLSHVHESVKPGKQDLRFRTGVGEVLLLRGENLPAFRLGRMLGRKRGPEQQAEEIAIIVRTENQPFATLVDDIIGQHQVVVKKLGDEVTYKGFSGSAILGDGKPALILELSEMIQGAQATKAVA